ncbi:MAG: hypothetical protein HYZ42_16065 [Bacteroidetes bacterium]|nr:hypothetical protein [Bacteroidota bacterium]
MNKIIGFIILFAVLVFSKLEAQELVQVQVSKRVANRLYMNVFNNVARKIYDEYSKGNLKAYKDELLQSPMSKAEFIKAGQYKQTISIEVKKDGKSVAADSSYFVSSTWEWIWGFRKLNNSHFALYYQKPKDVNTEKGEIVYYLNQLDLKNLLGKFEWKMINDITAKGNIGDKQHFVDIYWNQFANFKTKLWDNMIAAKTPPYQSADLKTKSKVEELKSTFQMVQMVTVIQDSLHREYDYQKAENLPFEPDSILGFGFANAVSLDPSSGNISLQPFAISPLFDPTNSGPSAYFLETMYWLNFNEVMKDLKPEDIAFLNELIYLAMSERLNTECVY